MIHTPCHSCLRTALHIVAERADVVLVNRLLECSKLKLHIRNRDGQTAYDLARLNGHILICKRLKEHITAAGAKDVSLRSIDMIAVPA